MEGHWNLRLPKVVDLLLKNRKRIEKTQSKINALNTKLQTATNRLHKLQAKEEKMRDSYDFYYEQHYYANTDGSIKTFNAHNKHLYENSAIPNTQKQRVHLPEVD